MSNASFKAFLPFVLERECAYDKHGNVIAEHVSGDAGGWTKYGIDQRSHPSVDVRNLSLDQATAIYLSEWNNHRCNALPSPLAEVVFDAFVTGGHPILWLQQSLNAVDHAGLDEDQMIGPMTIAAANVAPDKREVSMDMLKRRDTYFSSRGAYGAKFKQGWLNRDQELRNYINKLTNIV